MRTTRAHSPQSSSSSRVWGGRHHVRGCDSFWRQGEYSKNDSTRQYSSHPRKSNYKSRSCRLTRGCKSLLTGNFQVAQTVKCRRSFKGHTASCKWNGDRAFLSNNKEAAVRPIRTYRNNYRQSDRSTTSVMSWSTHSWRLSAIGWKC